MGVLGLADLDTAQVVGKRSLQSSESISSPNPHGAEVTHIEHHGAGTTGTMLVQSPTWIGQRHVPAAKGHQLGIKLYVSRFNRAMTQVVGFAHAVSAVGRSGLDQRFVKNGGLCGWVQLDNGGI